MKHIKELLKAYDILRSDDWVVDVANMTDEEIDKLIDMQWDMTKQLDVLIAHAKQQAEIRKKATKEEEEAKVMIRRIMERLELNDFDNEYWKVRTSTSYKYDVDLDNLDTEYLWPNHAKIRAKINKNEKIKWVQATNGYTVVNIK